MVAHGLDYRKTVDGIGAAGALFLSINSRPIIADVVKRELDKLMRRLLMVWTTGRRLMALVRLAR